MGWTPSGSCTPGLIEQWFPYMQRYGAPGGIDFHAAWTERESCGNPCSVGVAGVEAGLYQTWHPDDDFAGQTFSQLRAYCSGGSQTQTRAMTEDEKNAAVSAGINYVKDRIVRARNELASVGANWSESSPDFGMFVKLIHGAGPAGSLSFLRSATANLGRPPSSFDEMVQANTVPDPHNTLTNAQIVGRWWKGGMSFMQIGLLAFVAFGAYKLLQPGGLVGNPRRRRRRRRR